MRNLRIIETFFRTLLVNVIIKLESIVCVFMRYTSDKKAGFIFAFLLCVDHQSSCSFLQNTVTFQTCFLMSALYNII